MINVLLKQIVTVFNFLHCRFDCVCDVSLSGFMVRGAPLRTMLRSEHVGAKMTIIVFEIEDC
jgi:hypothetical protein